MINLPLLDSLDVTGYGLYPGDDPNSPGLHVRFQPGLTLVLGANGLGKTTLVTMLYRLLTGPFDVQAIMRDTDLGTSNLRLISLRSSNRRTFALRVSDNAENAIARLDFSVGDQHVSVERNLSDLTLRSFRVSGSPPSDDEIRYQEFMANLANVASFPDWILLLRYIMFYFEDRRSLVWDPTAQRQLLRILFLEIDKAQLWTDWEREILSLDSRMRNLRFVARLREQELASNESLAANEPQTRELLDELEIQRQGDIEALDGFNSELEDIEERHEQSRLRFLTLEQKRESKYRQLEQMHLRAVASKLPRHSDSARYILAQLLTDSRCGVCGSDVPEVVSSFEVRIQENKCVICASPMNQESEGTDVQANDQEIKQLALELQAIDFELDSARRDSENAQQERSNSVVRIHELRIAITRRTARIDQLIQHLPPEDAKLLERWSEHASLRAEVEQIQTNLDERRQMFEQIISDANAIVMQQSTEIQRRFGEYGSEFLLEDCRLVWSPKADQLGQSGERINFPAFALELGGSDFSGTVRRSSPEDVSESQREFIDISFRMALINVATTQNVGSLVMDAPESSLDAVFVSRAANVLGQFGRKEFENRLMITSNLVEGNLIPALLNRAADVGDRSGRVVNLFAIAAPTAAVRVLRHEYESAMSSLLQLAEDG